MTAEPEARATLPGELFRAIRQDPKRFPEHLVLIAQRRLAQPSGEWARHALETPDEIADLEEQLRTRTVRFARTNGLLAGTPFLIALVPAYATVLWAQARMVMRMAALNGRDPADRTFAAEFLHLRGLYATPQLAVAALSELGEAPPPARAGLVGRVRAWARLAYRCLILAGFVSPAEPGEAKRTRPRIVRALSLLWAGLVYAMTWVIPVTFMLVMSWSCESDTRRLADRALRYYGDGRASAKRPSGRNRRGRALFHVALVALSLGIPLGLVTIAVAEPVGHSHLVAIAGFVGLAIVIALSANAARR